MFHENKELIPSGDSSEISPGNNDPAGGITLVLVVIPFINNIGWVEVTKDY